MSPLEALAWLGVATVGLFILLLGYSIFTGVKDKRDITRRDAGLLVPVEPRAPLNLQPLCNVCATTPNRRHQCSAPGMCPCTGEHTV